MNYIIPNLPQTLWTSSWTTHKKNIVRWIKVWTWEIRGRIHVVVLYEFAVYVIFIHLWLEQLDNSVFCILILVILYDIIKAFICKAYRVHRFITFPRIDWKMNLRISITICSTLRYRILALVWTNYFFVKIFFIVKSFEFVGLKSPSKMDKSFRVVLFLTALIKVQISILYPSLLY